MIELSNDNDDDNNNDNGRAMTHDTYHQSRVDPGPSIRKV